MAVAPACDVSKPMAAPIAQQQVDVEQVVKVNLNDQHDRGVFGTSVQSET
jgi:hypothetical protein